MKKIIPYLISLSLGIIIGLLVLNKSNINIAHAFTEGINAYAFQVAVVTDLDTAKEISKKYPSSIIILDEDVYRIYYSILTNKNVVKKMEDYLNKEKISYYIKEIKINDNGLIDALNNYETTILEGNEDVLISINKLIMDSYGGNK